MASTEYTDVHVNASETTNKLQTQSELDLFTVEFTTAVEILLADNKEPSTKPWYYHIAYVIVPLLLIVGLFGNGCVILIMGRKNFRTTTTAVFLIALALSDTKFILLFPFTKSFTQELFNRDIKAITLTGCKTFFCMFRSAKIFSSWIVVFICIERFIVIWFPLQARRILTRQTASIFVLSLLAIIYTFDGVWTMTTRIVNGVCIPNFPKIEEKDLSTAFIIAGTLVYNVFPSIFLICLTPLTIFKLLRHRSERMKLTSNNVNRNDETYRITRMLLAVMIAYLILVTPISVAHSVAFFTGDNIFESVNKNFIIFREIAQIGEQLNYVINFFIYVTFNSTFRHTFLCVICRRTSPSAGAKSNQNLESRTSGDPQGSNVNTDTTNSH